MLQMTEQRKSKNNIEVVSTIPLSKTTKFIVDNRGRTAPTAPFGIALIATNCVSNDDLYPSYKNVRYVSPETYKTWFRSHPVPGDILLTNKGSQNGAICLVPDPVDFVIAQDMVALRADASVIDPLFLFAALRSPEVQRQIKNLDVSGVIPHLKKTDFDKLFLPYPDKNAQKQIGSLYFSLCKKIELNRRMNETLEALAQAIFKDWFVDFGPTRRKAMGETNPVAILGNLIPNPATAQKTAALFPATFGDDGLPEGWTEIPIDQIADFMNGYALQKYPALSDADSLPVIKIAELRNGLSKRSDKASRSIPEKYLVRDGDFLFSWSGSLLAKFWMEGEGALNQHLFKVTSTTHPTWFYTQWVHHHMVSFQQTAASKATTMGHIQRGHLSSAITTCPPQEAFPLMSKIMEPLIARTIHNDLENRTLAGTRDYLLPKLMSGEVRVRDAEKIAEDGVAHMAASTTSPSVFGSDLFGAPTLTPDQEIERDAVLVASVVKFSRGANDKIVVGNVKIQKDVYLIKRFARLSISTFAKEAAGPYDAALSHEGGKPEAMSKKWIIASNNATKGGKLYEGSAPGKKIAEIDLLIDQYGLKDAVAWAQQNLASKSTDELECLATVDFAMQTLRKKSIPPTLDLIKADIATDPVWKPKLNKSHFSNDAIRKAMVDLDGWFSEVQS